MAVPLDRHKACLIHTPLHLSFCRLVSHYPYLPLWFLLSLSPWFPKRGSWSVTSKQSNEKSTPNSGSVKNKEMTQLPESKIPALLFGVPLYSSNLQLWCPNLCWLEEKENPSIHPSIHPSIYFRNVSFSLPPPLTFSSVICRLGFWTVEIVYKAL